MPRKITQDEFNNRIKRINPGIEIVGEYKNSTTSIHVKCKKCGYEWNPTGKSLLAGHGCSKCAYRSIAEKRQKTPEQFLEDLGKKLPNIEAMETYKACNESISVRCKECGTEWKTTPTRLLQGIGCPLCTKNRTKQKLRKTHDQFMKEISIINPNIEILGKYEKSNLPIYVKCKKCGREWNTKPQGLLRGDGCSVCSGKMKRTQELFLNELAEMNSNIVVFGTYNNANEAVRVQCSICGHVWNADPHNLLRNSGCPNCAKYLRTSFPEQVLFYYLKQSYPDAVNSYMGIFDNKMELDIYIPSIRTGIEYDGAAWHENNRAYLRDKRKYEICKSKGVTLIRVREGDIPQKSDFCDILVQAKPNLEDTIDELREYLMLPRDINIIRDAGIIKRQYLVSNSVKGTTAYYAEQLLSINPDIEVIGEYISRAKPIAVRCTICGHEWNPSAGSLLLKQGCPKCGKRRMAEKNTKTQEQFLFDLEKVNQEIQILGTYVKSNIPIQARCKKCGHEWNPTPNNLLHGYGCPKCGKRSMAKKHTTTQFEFLNRMQKVNPDIIVLGEYTNNRTPVHVKCGKCGYEWDPTAQSLLAGHGCPKCAGNQKKTHEQFVYDLGKKNNQIGVIGEYTDSKTPVLVRCLICKNEWNAYPADLLHRGRCPKCSKKEVKKKLSKTHNQFISDLYVINPNIEVLSNYTNSKTPVHVRCKKCGREWDPTPNNLLHGYGCRTCSRKNNRKK